jgi:hypothetical protein
MSFRNLKNVTSLDIDFLQQLIRHWHRNFRAELVDCFVSYHNSLIDTGYINYSVHKGDDGKFTRAGFTYKIGNRAAVCFNIDKKGFKFLFYRGAGRQPYANQKLVSFTKINWSGFIYLTPATMENIYQCSEESAKLLIKSYDQGQFRIIYNKVSPPLSPTANDIDEPKSERMETKVFRILRDTKMCRRIKLLHDSKCQICGHRIALNDGSYYSETHHIQPLGEPHNGPDIEGNIICVCPNHHAELDYFASRLDLTKIKPIDGHRISQKYVDYHNQRHDKR